MPGKLHQCVLCIKVFPNFHILNDHLRVHTGERPFKCDVCGKRFTQNCNLERHKRIHSGLKPFPCSFCTKAFFQKSNLQKHENIHRGLKPYQCTQCSACFVQAQNLTRHKKVHIQVKPFQCKICWKSFGRQESLNAHKMTHSISERKLECEDCGKKLYQELKPSFKGPPYSCKVCGNDFQNWFGLHAHMKQHFGQLADKCNDCVGALLEEVRGSSRESFYRTGLMTDCLFCEEKFPQEDLESHMRSHTRE